MRSVYSNAPTDEIFDFVQSDDVCRDGVYEATQELLARWRRGRDLAPLLGLLEAKDSGKRLIGVYYLNEIGGPVEELRCAAVRLADDPISDCRRIFINYISESGFYDESIARALSKALFDLDLYVRLTVIRWGVRASEDQFADLRRWVRAGVGCPEPRLRDTARNDSLREIGRRRGARGLLIIEQIRNGTDVRTIEASVRGEDSFVLDLLEFQRGPRTRREC